jgi:hypothetical protein
MTICIAVSLGRIRSSSNLAPNQEMAWDRENMMIPIVK